MSIAEKTLQSFGNWKIFLDNFSPKQMVVNFDNVRNIYDVLREERLSLSTLSEIYPIEKSIAGFEFMKEWIEFLNVFSNINKILPKQVIHPLAYTLYSRYSRFTLADLKVVFDFILEGRYGTFYGSVDTQLILSAFAKYNADRIDSEKKLWEQQEKERFENINIDPANVEKAKQVMKNFYDHFNNK